MGDGVGKRFSCGSYICGRFTSLAAGDWGLVFNVSASPVGLRPSKGGGIMAEIPDGLEVERLVNLVAGFGWVITKQEFKTDRIILTVEMERASTESPESAGPT